MAAVKGFRLVNQFRSLFFGLALEQHLYAWRGHAVMCEETDQQPRQHQVATFRAEHNWFTLQRFNDRPGVWFVWKRPVGGFGSGLPPVWILGLGVALQSGQRIAGIQLLDRFCQDGRIRIRQPRRNVQIKFTRTVSETNDFVAYVDAIGKLDGTRCLLEWKTTSSRYPEEPDGLLALDPQLACYSWMTGISDVAQVVFVRKRLVEVQYLRTTITEEQRTEFGPLVEDTIRRVESAQFLPHSGIRFPQNPCSTCPYLGLCLGKPELINIALARRPGAENLGWLDELAY